MKAVVILMCLLGTTCSVPLQVYHQRHQQIQQQTQAQEPQPGILRYPSISLEMMQDIARYKRFKQQHPQMFPSLNLPAQPLPPKTTWQSWGQSSSLRLPQFPPLFPPQQYPQQPPQFPQSSPQLPPKVQLAEFLPGLQQERLINRNQQYEYESPVLFHQVPPQQSTAVPAASNDPATPQASVQPTQQDQQPGQRGDQPEHQVQIPNAQGQQPSQQDQQLQFPGYSFLMPAAFPQQQAQPGQEQQQQMYPQVVYVQLQPGMAGGAFGSVSSEELQVAGGLLPGFAGFIPGFAGQAFGGGIPSFGGSVPGAEGSIPFGGVVPIGQGTNPVAPEAGLPTAEILPAGQGGGPTVPEVIPTGQGSPPTMFERGNQPAPQSKLPTVGLTTPAWVRMLTPGNSPAA
ncbi:glutenin, high molecular weight subunit DX5-like isoform X2 [Polyodon spathula]|uniref:glutenin, high molecular weight subunit DX5-like isoform X2 n=1 Tax=Polyodon spathula TaxID=7913 RepID=UPI001B7E6390|nr:glutenin, high molecular weight subunit DX5-like isoform X2 [Polyodon spathula]